MKREFWKDKKVLITGHNGFKGCWLTKWLDMAGAYTCGISLPAEKESIYYKLNFSARHCYYECDIRRSRILEQTVQNFQPEIVFHLAAQAIVRTAKEKPAETFSTNVMGTVNLLEVLRHCSNVHAIIVVTSDKVYENTEGYIAFTEGSRLGGNEPYSASKACAEFVVKAYRDIYFSQSGIGTATARASNIFGGGDHHFDRLLPYLMKSVYEGVPATLRNPDAIRPWQYILDVLRGYLCLAEHLYGNPGQYSQAYNFGPAENDLYTVGEIAEILLQRYAGGQAERSFYEANILMINSNKSKRELEWKPLFSVKQGLERTQWMYGAYFEGKSMNDLMEQELNHYWKMFSSSSY